MAVTYRAAGTVALGTTSLAVPHPATIVAGELLLIVVGGKYDTNPPSTPAGWNALSAFTGGSGSPGTDIGICIVQAFWKIAAGGETGNVTVTITGGNSWNGIMYAFTPGAGETINTPVESGGSFNTAGTAFIITTASNIGCAVGDVIVCVNVTNNDLYTTSTHTITVPGCTTTSALAG